MGKSYHPKPGVPDEVRKFMARSGSIGGKRGSRADKVRAAKKVKKKSRRLAAAVTNNKRFGTPIPPDLLHGAAGK